MGFDTLFEESGVRARNSMRVSRVDSAQGLTMQIQRGTGTGNDNDCFVQTLANAYRLQYSDALGLASSCGYTPQRGTMPREIVRLWQFIEVSMTAYGYTGTYARMLRKIQYPDAIERRNNPAPPSLSVSSWLKIPENQTGRYMIMVSRHIFAVVHGNILDDYAFAKPEELLKRRIQVVARVSANSIDNLHLLLKGNE